MSLRDNGGSSSSLWTDAGTYIHAINATDVVVTDTGNVGIGTVNPTEKLDVNGNIHASGSLICGNSITIDGTANEFHKLYLKLLYIILH
ncbi:MAG: hypothetical protein ACMUIP_15905 [bacterium]